MTLTQEQLDLATTKIESHLKDIGILNQFTLKQIVESDENKAIRIFIYEIANPTFSTSVSIVYDFNKELNQQDSSPSFSWMDYKKITE
ncbi:hypothetical protein [Faecalibacter bovis]|uniref:Uncharacterized protein n=1 Tax=Faecalibacter bovis TaxID=2898187 RepID=A0ABX7XCY9_9FLAO|nr:hypothetical protein [Faecalibacter bovis]MBS7334024.1 hypothetical protein [Weeksellaceae bacterium]QTV05776.1 hypothetical protein J9309_13585 [Faecalibacter bovis]